jgi:phage shock protein C
VSSYRKPFRVNRDEGKVMGVCAGFADHFEIDVSLVRVATVLAVLMTFPMVLIAYFILGAVASDGGQRSRRRRRPVPAGAPRLDAPTADATRQRMRDLDARMQAVETYVTSSNTALAREIDELR